ncbi:MAG: hypothetical protein HFH79_00260 [Lachnospiraceae bacterium]|nr:hypothetical protein [Lachnospiraceae bacterium]
MLKAKMHKYRQFVKLTCWMLLSFMTTLALTMEFGLPDYMDVDFTVSSEWLVNLEKSLTVDAFKSSVVFLFTLLVSKIIEYVNQDRIKFSEYKIFYLICLMIGIVWLMAKSFVINNSLTNIYETTGQIVKSIIYYIGTVNLLIFIGKAIFLFADSQCSKPLHDSESNKETKKSGYRTFLFLIALWIPHLVIAYPASIISDAWSQLSMFYGRKIFTSHHPPFHTLVIGMAVKMGEKMGSANMGLFLFIVAQSILFALVISYGITTMKKMDSPKWLIRLTLFIAVTSPYYTAYIGLITKDTLYSYFFLLFIIELIYERIIPRGGIGKIPNITFFL